MMNYIIIPIVLFLVCILLGVVTKYIAHFQERKNNFVVGFVMIFASFYLISTLFMLLNLKFYYNGCNIFISNFIFLYVVWKRYGRKKY